MFSIDGRAARLCDGISRREWLKIGGLGLGGMGLGCLTLPRLLAARDTAPAGILPTDKSFGRAKNVIFLYLLGGPPQHETFDPKPEAPAEIRGAFKPIATTVPGTQFCELLPRTARMAHKLAVVRSISTDDNNHDSSGYQLLTGYKYIGPNSRTIQPTDWPNFGSLVKMLKPSEEIPPLSAVWVPDVWRLNENVTPAGQTGGFLGTQWNPDVFVGDPADPKYQVQGLSLSELPTLRIRQREELLKQVQRHFAANERGERAVVYNKFQQQAFDLITSAKARQAFDIAKEPDKLRDRYGRYTWGQSLLLARRLVESGVRLVHVNWPREPGDNAVDNPLWDTHAQNADRLEDVLCPQFDVSFAALIDDLDERGMLDETLVVAIGEFGRTPKINGNGGRDHWGPVFSFAMAGAGIAAGALYGASDAQGGYPAKDRVSGGDFTATIFHLLGINWQGTFHDREGREHKITTGQPIYPILGIEPAVRHRAEAGGAVARVPPFDRSLLLNTDFSAPVPLFALSPSRPKGWRASPALEGDENTLGVKLIDAGAFRPVAAEGAEKKHQHAAIGIGLGSSAGEITIDEGAESFLAQEVRSPMAGTYRMTLRFAGDGSSQEFFENVLVKNFTFRLVYFQYTEAGKNPLNRKELAGVDFVPKLADPEQPSCEELKLEKVFENPMPGGNFSFGLGMGAAVIVKRTTPGKLTIPAGSGPQRAMLRIDSLAMEFVGKPRKEDVVV
ncbi:MAG: DUF1501 domain-containing protein [Planctomycetia bacterium]|nr:DUF1501 domain-containing protein [Planctomycetia bacterium]